MQENIKGLYAAFKAKDARFDGRFFVGISSTGIYCRPVCKARQPKAENCTFFRTAAAAEQAGYRPCLLCRPELAPGTSVTDATADLVYRAARMLELRQRPEPAGNSRTAWLYGQTFAARIYCGIPRFPCPIFTDLPLAACQKSAYRHRSFSAGSCNGGRIWQSAPF